MLNSLMIHLTASSNLRFSCSMTSLIESPPFPHTAQCHVLVESLNHIDGCLSSCMKQLHRLKLPVVPR